MAGVRARGMLEVLFLLFVTSTNTKASDPPRNCINTGPTCIESCVGEADGDYQWCGSCQWFIKCSDGVTYFQQCPENLYWHDSIKACVALSSSCTECVIDTSSNTVTGTTINPTPPVADLCQSTGPDCISDCDLTSNGIYQWCARCDYFLQCSGSTTYYTACQAGLYYDNTEQACVYNSTTCHQNPCYVDIDASTTPIVDRCSSAPCLNDGTCISNTSSIRCVCPERYTGDLCETFVDPCSSAPCLNDGTCISNTSSIRCVCSERYTGDLCETFVDPCSSAPCLNDGTCISNTSSIRCVCSERYTGDLCETFVDPCSSAPCFNDGTCISNTSSIRCVCPERYTGDLCETFVDHCLSLPCLNDGTCTYNGSDISCLCLWGYTGALCETKLYDMNATCGDLMHSTPYDPAPGWTKLCEITKTGDEDLVNTPCQDLLQGLPVYGNSAGLLHGGGNYGCYLTSDYPSAVQNACFDNYQQNHSLSMCYSCQYMVVCLRYPS